jgi:hypothetical protein
MIIAGCISRPDTTDDTIKGMPTSQKEGAARFARKSANRGDYAEYIDITLKYWTKPAALPCS